MMASPLLAGIAISPRFAEALGMAEEKQSQQQMTHQPLNTPKVNTPSISDVSSAAASELPPEEFTPNSLDEAVEWGINKYVDYKGYDNLESHQKIFYDTVVKGGKEKTPITAKDFKPEEIEQMRGLLQKKLKAKIDIEAPFFAVIDKIKAEIDANPKKDWTKDYKDYVLGLSGAISEYKKTGKVSKVLYDTLHPGKTNYWENLIRYERKVPKDEKFPNVLSYGDYAEDEYDVGAQRSATGGDPTSTVHLTLGQFSGEFDPETQGWKISEQYDFNRRGVFGPTNVAPQYGDSNFETGSPAYDIVRTYAGRKAAAGSKKYTRPVNIDLLPPVKQDNRGLLGTSAVAISELEEKVKQDLQQLDNTGYERLPGAAGKRDSDPGEPFLQKMMKSYPEVFKADPEKTSEMQQFENRLRHKYKMKEDDIQQLMMPMWSTILHSDKPTDDLKKKTYQNKLKSTEAPDPLLTAVEKLAGMIEGMNKPKTIIRDKDGKIMGVA